MFFIYLNKLNIIILMYTYSCASDCIFPDIWRFINVLLKVINIIWHMGSTLGQHVVRKINMMLLILLRSC